MTQREGLRLVFRAGFVHRDISSGNIIVVADGHGRSQAKLSDFEYSSMIVRKPTTTHEEHKTVRHRCLSAVYLFSLLT
jgi:serine/threonine protein kinase